MGTDCTVPPHLTEQSFIHPTPYNKKKDDELPDIRHGVLKKIIPVNM